MGYIHPLLLSSTARLSRNTGRVTLVLTAFGTLNAGQVTLVFTAREVKLNNFFVSGPKYTNFFLPTWEGL